MAEKFMSELEEAMNNELRQLDPSLGTPMAYNAPLVVPHADPQPFPGLRVRPPKRGPQAGEVVIRYDIVKGKGGCCNCDDLTEEGVAWVVCCALFCFPCAWIPCVKDKCHQDTQVPVYGPPPAHHSAPLAPQPQAAPAPHAMQPPVQDPGMYSSAGFPASQGYQQPAYQPSGYQQPAYPPTGHSGYQQPAYPPTGHSGYQQPAYPPAGQQPGYPPQGGATSAPPAPGGYPPPPKY